MDLIKEIVILIIIVITLVQPCFSVELNDWICIPGQKVGPITKETIEKDLMEIFGNVNVRNYNYKSCTSSSGDPTVISSSDFHLVPFLKIFIIHGFCSLCWTILLVYN